MTNSIIKSFAKKTGKTEEDVEKLWDKAIEIAKEKDVAPESDEFYKVVTGTLKKMLKIDEEFAVGVADAGLASGVPEGGAAVGVLAQRLHDTPISRINSNAKKKKKKKKKKFIEFLNKR